MKQTNPKSPENTDIVKDEFDDVVKQAESASESNIVFIGYDYAAEEAPAPPEKQKPPENLDKKETIMIRVKSTHPQGKRWRASKLFTAEAQEFSADDFTPAQLNEIKADAYLVVKTKES